MFHPTELKQAKHSPSAIACISIPVCAFCSARVDPFLGSIEVGLTGLQDCVEEAMVALLDYAASCPGVHRNRRELRNRIDIADEVKD